MAHSGGPAGNGFSNNDQQNWADPNFNFNFSFNDSSLGPFKNDQAAANLNNGFVHQSQAQPEMPRDLPTPPSLGALSVSPTTVDAQFPLSDQRAADNAANKDNAIINGISNTQLPNNGIMNLMAEPAPEGPNAAPGVLNTPLTSGFPPLFGQPVQWNGNFTMSDNSNNNNNHGIHNNGFIPGMTANTAAWQMPNAMPGAQFTYPQPTVFLNSPYQQQYTAQGFVNNAHHGMYGGLNQPSASMGQAGFPQPGFASQSMPKRRVSGQETNRRRVSPSHSLHVGNGASRNAQAAPAAVPGQVSAHGSSAQQPSAFSVPTLQGSNGLANSAPQELVDAFNQAQELRRPFPAERLSPKQRLGITDFCLRLAFSRGTDKGVDILAEEISNALLAGTFLGGSVQLAAEFGKAKLEHKLKEYLFAKTRFKPNEQPAAAARNIRDCVEHLYPGIYCSPSRHSPVQTSALELAVQTPQTPQPPQPARKKPTEKASAPKPKANATSASKTTTKAKKTKAQREGQKPEKKEKKSKENCAWIFTGRVIPRRFSDSTHMAYVCSDGQNRILSGENFEAVLKRTKQYHEAHGTEFKFWEDKKETSTASDANPREQKRKAAEPTGDEPAAKKPSDVITQRQPDLILPGTPSLILPGAPNLVLPGAPTPAVVDSTNAATIHSADGQGMSRAERDSVRINELIKLDKGLPQSIIMGFMHPQETSPYEVVREAARHGLGDQSFRLEDKDYRNTILKAFDADSRARMQLMHDDMPVWDAQARNKEKRDRKKAAQVEQLQAACESRNNAAETSPAVGASDMEAEQPQEDCSSRANVDETLNATENPTLMGDDWSPEMEAAMMGQLGIELDKLDAEMAMGDFSDASNSSMPPSTEGDGPMLGTDAKTQHMSLSEEEQENMRTENFLELEALIRATYDDPEYSKSAFEDAFFA